MEIWKRKKYTKFIMAYILNDTICLNGMMLKKYGEDFFNNAVKDNILEERGQNDIGQRQFRFTDFARQFI